MRNTMISAHHSRRSGEWGISSGGTMDIIILLLVENICDLSKSFNL